MLKKEVGPILWEEEALKFQDKYIVNPHVLDGILYWLNVDGELKNLIIEKALKLTYNTYGIGIGYWKIEEYIVQPN
jgi:hypothetical protein